MSICTRAHLLSFIVVVALTACVPLISPATPAGTAAVPGAPPLPSSMASPTAGPVPTVAAARTSGPLPAELQVEVVRLAAHSVQDWADDDLSPVHWIDDGRFVCFAAGKEPELPYAAQWLGYDLMAGEASRCPVTPQELIPMPTSLPRPDLPASVPAGARAWYFSPTGRQILASSRQGQQETWWLANLDTGLGVALSPQPACFSPWSSWAVTWSPDESDALLWDACVLQGSGYTIWRLDPTDGTLTAWYESSSGRPNGLLTSGPVSEDGAWVLYQDDEGRSHVANRDRSVEYPIPDGHRFAWIPGGHRLLIDAEAETRLIMFDAETGAATTLLTPEPPPWRIQLMSPSPDGRYVVVASRVIFDRMMKPPAEPGVWLVSLPAGPGAPVAAVMPLRETPRRAAP